MLRTAGTSLLQAHFETNPLYFCLHEAIYCDGERQPSAWAAERVQASLGPSWDYTKSLEPDGRPVQVTSRSPLTESLGEVWLTTAGTFLAAAHRRDGLLVDGGGLRRAPPPARRLGFARAEEGLGPAVRREIALYIGSRRVLLMTAGTLTTGTVAR